jgi:glycosyltransferase involved in cell wall biosynthesis
MIEHIYILRKTPMDVVEDKITCLSLPWFLRQRPIYWFLTSFYGLMLMKKYSADMILSYNIFPHGFNAYLASKIAGVTAIFAEINEDTKKYYRYLIPRILIRMIMKNAKVICVPGQQTANFWDLKGFNKTFSLHSTIDIHKFKPLNGNEKIFDYIFVGVFNRNKRPELILDAFCEVQKKRPAATLCIIGFGGLESEIKKRIEQAGLMQNVTLIRTDAVLEYFHKSKIFIMASLSEGLPCAMMEAMATGLAVIVPAVGDIPDVIQHNINGYIYNNSKEELIHYMDEVYNNYASLDILRAKARETIVSGHSYQVATEKWDELLKNI